MAENLSVTLCYMPGSGFELAYAHCTPHDNDAYREEGLYLILRGYSLLLLLDTELCRNSGYCIC